MILSALSILLISCRTSEAAATEITLEIPEYKAAELKRPVLDTIPDLDVTDFSEDQIQRVAEVLAVYNGNMVKLVVYIERLESENEIQTQYMQSVIEILNEGR